MAITPRAPDASALNPPQTLNGGGYKPSWGAHNKDYSILESTLGSPYVGKLPKPDTLRGFFGLQRPGWPNRSDMELLFPSDCSLEIRGFTIRV